MRHHDQGGEGRGHFNFGRHQWVPLDGTVLECRILHPERSAPHARLFVVRLQPPGQPPFDVELILRPADGDYGDIAQPDAGEVRSFLYDPRSGKLQFDLEDPRNNLTEMIGELEYRNHQTLMMIREAAAAKATARENQPDDGY